MSGGRAEGKEGEGPHHGDVRVPGNCKLVLVLAHFRGDVVVRDTGGAGQVVEFDIAVLLQNDPSSFLGSVDMTSNQKFRFTRVY